MALELTALVSGAFVIAGRQITLKISRAVGLVPLREGEGAHVGGILDLREGTMSMFMISMRWA